MEKKNSSLDLDQEFASLDEKNETFAQYLSSILDADPVKMLKFVKKNPKISVSDLATKWF